MSVMLRRFWETDRVRVLLAGSGVLLFMLLLLVVLQQMGTAAFKGMEDVSSFAKGFDIRAFTDPDSVLSNMIGVGLTHPLMLAMVGSIAIGLGARSCAGELEAGTIELALSRPVPRRTFLGTYVAFINVVIVVLMTVTGTTVLVGAPLVGVEGRIGIVPMVETCVVAALLFSSLGAIATLISTIAPARSTALVSGIAVLVAAYFVEFFARIWDSIAWLGPFSPFHYLKPTETLIGATGMPWRDALTLAGISIVANAVALIRFERRDLA